MAITWNQIKINIPGVGDRAYVFAQYTMSGGVCIPNQVNVGRQCQIMSHVEWNPGEPFEGLFPNVGEWISSSVNNQFIQCLKVLEIIDEATFMTGTCTSCYNNGWGGNCSDLSLPYSVPGDPNGCRYDNSIVNGIDLTSFGVVSSFVTYIQTDCQNCTTGAPPVFEPNMLVNCCDPSETYQLASTLLEHITGTGITLGVNQLGINTFTQAFRADLYIGGATTGYKCWHLKEDYPPFGPTAYQGTPGSPTVFDDCTLLNTHVIASGHDPCCGPPPMEWCCMTGTAGPAGTPSCVLVAGGSCVVGNANVFAGPFATQADCINHPCGSPCPPTDPNSPFNSPSPLAVAEFCAQCLIPSSVYFGHQDCQCCDPIPPDECEPPFAKLAVLTNKLDKFTKWKKKSLGKK